MCLFAHLPRDVQQLLRICAVNIKLQLATGSLA